MRVEVAAPWVQAPVFPNGFRLFSNKVQGTCLDKHVFTDRVLSVVKKCRKLIMPRWLQVLAGDVHLGTKTYDF
jgi:hypothetical protein